MDLPSPEILLVAVVVVAAILGARYRWRWLGWWERPLAKLANREWLAVVIAAALPLVVRAVLLPIYPAPQPRVQDEFSFLLGADTFAHGRLANPQHPMWVHFDSMHIFVRPVYGSAFPAAPALAMAAGQVLFGHAWLGVWLSGGLMCGAMCWMLQGWLPKRWALLGALLVVLRIGISSYWMNGYWGGFMAAAGGALVLGAIPRIMRRPGWRPAAAMAVGLLLMANSRPFEGLLFAVLLSIPFLAWMATQKARHLRVVIVAGLLVLALGAVLMAWDFDRITGKPWMLPYLQFRNAMTTAPHFVWMQPGPRPLYSNRQVRDFYVDWELACYGASRTAVDLLRKLIYWRFYIGPLLTIPLLAIPWLWRDRRGRELLLIAAGFSLGMLAEVWHNIHYAAPATGLAILVVVLCMRRLRVWRWRGASLAGRGNTGDLCDSHRVCTETQDLGAVSCAIRTKPAFHHGQFGLYLVRGIPSACLAMFVIQVVAGPYGANGAAPGTWRWPEPAGLARAGILKQLASTEGRHLVLVRYVRGHDTGDEWVYNGADIDGSKVVWARELDRESNQKLLRYFAGRKVWLVEPDRANPSPVPYGDAPPRLMEFVQLGAPGVDVLDPLEVKRRVLQQTGSDEAAMRTCDVWNFEFSRATGVEGPDVSTCFEAGERTRPVRFAHWFEWLKRVK